MNDKKRIFLILGLIGVFLIVIQGVDLSDSVVSIGLSLVIGSFLGFFLFKEKLDIVGYILLYIIMIIVFLIGNIIITS